MTSNASKLTYKQKSSACWVPMLLSLPPPILAKPLSHLGMTQAEVSATHSQLMQGSMRDMVGVVGRVWGGEEDTMHMGMEATGDEKPLSTSVVQTERL